jgi:hypothetical protein
LSISSSNHFFSSLEKEAKRINKKSKLKKKWIETIRQRNRKKQGDETEKEQAGRDRKKQKKQR